MFTDVYEKDYWQETETLPQQVVKRRGQHSLQAMGECSSDFEYVRSWDEIQGTTESAD
jgi:hypothetical protein